jgi:hypothetical protein
MFTEACFSQPNVDIWINSTANPAAGKIWAFYKAEHVPSPWYDKPLNWIMNYPNGAARAFRRKGIPGSSVLKYPAGLAAWTLDVARRRNQMGNPSAAVRSINGFDERFDDLWAVLRRRPNRLHAARDRETLAWHFKIPIQRGRAVILVLEEGADLLGYTILLRSGDANTGWEELVMVDLQVASDNAEHVRSLVSGALHAARKLGVDNVGIVGFSTFKHQVMEQFRPRRGKGGRWPFFYKARDPALHAALRSLDAWDPCRYDGDASLLSV